MHDKLFSLRTILKIIILHVYDLSIDHYNIVSDLGKYVD